MISIKSQIKGMILARKLGLMSYRSAQEWHQNALIEHEYHLKNPGGDPFDIEFEVESYLDYNAKKFSRNFDAKQLSVFVQGDGFI